MYIIAAGAFQVQGPHEPLVAMLGGEAELPCFLLPPQNVKNMEIRWTRSLPSHLVHLYEDGRDKPEETMEEYHGRTELVKNFMHKGMVTLRIRQVQPSDNGQYRCAFQNGFFYSDAVIELKVAALGSRPQVHVEVTESQQLRLECKSEGWFPQPEVQWMDSEGGEIPAESETHTQDKSGLFHVKISLLLGETSQKNLTCSVWNPVLNQKKEEQLSIAVAESKDMKLIIMDIIGALALLVLLIFIITWLYLNKCRKTATKGLRLRPCSTGPAGAPATGTMADLHELSQLYEESNDVQMNMGGELYEEINERQMEVMDCRNREPSPGHPGNRGQPQPEEEGLMEEEGAQAMAAVVAGSRGLASRPGPGELPGEFARSDFDDNDSGADFDDSDSGDDYDYPEKEQQRETTLNKVRKFFQRKSSDGEVATDGRFQMHSENTRLERLVRLQERHSLLIVSLQAEEPSCDETVDDNEVQEEETT